MSEVYAQTAAPAGSGVTASPEGGFGSLLPIIVLWGAVLYFLFIRPQKKKEKNRKALLDNLKKKDEVITVGGLMGRVDSIIYDVVTLRVADNLCIRVQRTAISRIVGDDDKEAK